MDPAAKRKICWGCKQEGHTKKVCSNKKESVYNDAGFISGMKVALCWQCKRPGHRSFECPNKLKAAKSQKGVANIKEKVITDSEGKAKTDSQKGMANIYVYFTESLIST
ncbi:hypothetical protein MLD38_021582 [Melastoma candidum]|uniref:Uncharacterized protein n=1 Tax=Melastoma candidum TaxID=119954 RepID=A0ACB9QKE8_9MYRT|nr:hypothetical protein MLD38_021582 [Melastoma candidum]